jgi:hypothetical protein
MPVSPGGSRPSPTVKLLPDLPVGIAVTLAWFTLAYRLPRLWRHLADPRLRCFCVLMAVIAAGLTLEFPEVSLAIDRWAAIPNLTVLLGDLLTAGGAAATCALMAHLRHPDPRAGRLGRRFRLVTVAVLVLLVGFFLASPRLPEDTDYWARYGGAPPGLLFEYRTLRSAFLAVCAWYVVRQCWTFTRSSLRFSTRLGFGLILTAGIGAELSVANDVVLMLPARLDLSWLARRSYALEILIASLALVGFTVPNWGPRAGIDAAAGWVAEYRSLQRLFPLWRALCDAVPGVAMIPPGGRLADLLDPRDVHFRLHRRVVEIRDALHLLAPGRAISGHRPAPGQEGPADLRGEARALERLSRALTAGPGSPIGR